VDRQVKMASGKIGPFGALLKRYRLAAGLTQEELAERARLSVRGITDLERGARRTPHKDTVQLLATALALPEPDRARLEAAARHQSAASAPLAGFTRPSGAAMPPLIGRAHELDLLGQHLLGEGPPLLMLAGEPGIGKSRLLREASGRAVGHGWCVLEGGCQRRGGQDPYAPLLGALQQYLRARPSAQLRADLRGCAWLVRLLPELADGPIEPLPAWVPAPAQERRLMLEAIIRFLGNVAGRAGTLLVLDDLQWAGADALDLLDTLVRAAPEAPLRLVGAYRDTEVQQHDLLGVSLADHAQAGLVRHHLLAPLSETEVTQLLDGLLQDAVSDEQVRRRVAQRAGGVPFFAVSCAQALHTAGPTNHQADAVSWDVAQSVRQRVAALSEEARDILSMAAIAGRVVSRSMLARANARPDSALVAALEDACRARLLEEAGQGAYQFAHDVIREVVEADLGAARRVLLHCTVAGAIEVAYAGRLPEHYEALAHHYAQGEVWDKALHYIARAAEKAAAAYANQSALDLYARALAVCEQLGDSGFATAITIALQRGGINNGLGNTGDAIADFDKAIKAARRLGDRHSEGLALVQRGMSQFWDHDLDATEESLRTALVIAEEGFDDVRFAGSVWLGGMYASTGRWPEGKPILRVAEELGSRIDDPFHQFWWSAFYLNQLNWQGRYAEALAITEATRGAASQHMFTLVASWWHEALFRAGKGEYQPAFALLDRVLVTCEQVGEPTWLARALNLMGWLYTELQDHRQALEWNTRGVQAARELLRPDLEIQSNALLNLADDLLALGRAEEAEQHLLEVDRVVRYPRPQDRISLERFSQHHYHSYGELWLARGVYDKALACAADCLAIAEPGGHRKNIVKGRRLRAQVFLAQGQLADAERELDAALVVARPLGNPPQLWKTLAVFGDLRTTQERVTEAHQAYQEALTVIRDVAADLADPALRETLLASDQVRRIQRLAE
jgi:tetratricopeptide (TPR) repeat protein/transcriptional regulator with XRE-family HTH domain